MIYLLEIKNKLLMKKYWILFFVLCVTYSFSQNKKELLIEYQLLLNLNTSKKHNPTLYYKNNNSYFHWNNTESSESELEADDEGNYKFEIVVTDSIGTINHVNFLTDTITSRFLHFKNPHVLKEKRTQIAWKLQKETKVIGNFTCNKAIGAFRGRMYIVWYTPKIPLPIGPWKLNGLSGLIVEAYDATKKVHFYLKSIKTNKKPRLFDYDTVFKEGKQITLKEHAKNQSELVDDLMKKLQAKFPRNVKVEIKTTGEFLEKEFNFQQE